MNIPDKNIVEFGPYRGVLEMVECPICSSPPSPSLIYRNKNNIGFYRCPGCKIIFASPRFDEPSLLAIYENESFRDMSVYEGWSFEKWQKEGGRLWHLSQLKVDLVKRYAGEGVRVLDVGSSTGEFCVAARHQKLRAEGIDISRMLTETALKYLHAPVQVADVETFDPDYRFKGIMLWDVMEHLFDPVRIIKACHRLLEPGGFLFAQVPNAKGLSNRFKSLRCQMGLSTKDYKHFGFPYHLYFFDEQSLTALMAHAGLCVHAFESWCHMVKDGAHHPLAKMYNALSNKLLFSDYIIVVAQKPF